MDRQRIFTIAAAVIIIVCGFAVYMNSLGGEFIWDDIFLITDNVHIKAWGHLPKLFTENINAGSGRTGSFYRPALMLTLMIDYSIWELDERGYHLTTVIFHILAGLCVYGLINMLFGERLLSFLTSLFFVIHPIQAEDVAYITGRADSMTLMFMLLALIFYIKNLRSESVRYYTLMLVCFICALLSKESGMIFPGLVLLYHYAFKERIRAKPFVSVMGVAVVFLLFRLTALRSLPIYTAYFSGILDRLPGFFVALANYLRILLFPFGLHSGYANRLFSFTEPQALIGMGIFSALAVYAFVRRNSDTPAFFSISWFFIAILPVSNIVYPASDYMAERYLYIPSMGFFLIMAGLLRRLYVSQGKRRLAAACIILLSLFYSVRTVAHNGYWSDPVRFYQRTIKYVPNNAEAYNNLGLVYSKKGETGKAIFCYQKALKLNPDLAEVYNNLGAIYTDIFDKQDAAVQFFLTAARIEPGFAAAYHNLGVAYTKQGKREEAIAAYKKALELYPEYAGAHANIAKLYLEDGQRDLAAEHYSKAVRFGAKPGK